MKKLIVIIAAMLLSGCFYQSITVPEIEMGIAICQVKEQNQPREFSADFSGNERVTCYNGAAYLINKENLK